METLPNLRSLNFTQEFCLFRPLAVDFARLLPVLQHAPLRELVLFAGTFSTIEGPPTAGLSGLEKLSIHWNFCDHQCESSTTHLYDFIRLSLTTLVELRITFLPKPLVDFDIRLLHPAGDTLRVFQWFVPNHDESILDIVPEIMPNLVTLKIEWTNYIILHSVLWKVCIFYFT